MWHFTKHYSQGYLDMNPDLSKSMIKTAFTGGEWIHVYVCRSPFTIHLKLSQHCLSAIPPIQNKRV